MKDRLHKDQDEIHNVDEIIEARAGESSLFTDVEIPEDVDVDEALTFPHPKHKRRDTDHIDLMGTPHEEDVEDSLEDQDILPTDYEHGYDEATDTHATDDLDMELEDTKHIIGHVDIDDVVDLPGVEVMPKAFSADEEETE